MPTSVFEAAPRTTNFAEPSNGMPVTVAFDTATLSLDIPQTDRDNPLASLEVRIEFANNPNGPWEAYIVAGWQGGTGFVDKQGMLNPAPQMTLGGSGLAGLIGQRVRGGISVLGMPITIGGTISVT